MDTVPLAFRAPAPVPHQRPLGAVAFVLTAYRNPLEIWGERAYTQPYVVANWLGNPTIIVSDAAEGGGRTEGTFQAWLEADGVDPVELDGVRHLGYDRLVADVPAGVDPETSVGTSEPTYTASSSSSYSGGGGGYSGGGGGGGWGGGGDVDPLTLLIGLTLIPLALTLRRLR